jgi:hypothetical protein
VRKLKSSSWTTLRSCGKSGRELCVRPGSTSPKSSRLAMGPKHSHGFVIHRQHIARVEKVGIDRNQFSVHLLPGRMPGKDDEGICFRVF